MIEREFIRNKVKNLNIKKRIEQIIEKSAGTGRIFVERTPLNETVTIDAVRPGLIIGRRGETIKKLTDEIKRKYKLDNPQIKVREITEPNLNASSVARKIASDLERFGSKRFKAIGHQAVAGILRAGALGAEISLSGKIPGARAKTWRFNDGYMKKCGEISDSQVDTCIESATLSSGVIGIQVRIMRADIRLPDKLVIVQPTEAVEEKVEISVKTAEETETKEEAAKAIAKEEKKEKAVKEKIETSGIAIRNPPASVRGRKAIPECAQEPATSVAGVLVLDKEGKENATEKLEKVSSKEKSPRASSKARGEKKLSAKKTAAKKTAEKKAAKSKKKEAKK